MASSLLRAELRDFAVRFKLTPREQDVFYVLASGTARVRAIAEQLGLRENTVYNHFKRIFRKTATDGKVELIALFLDFCLQRQAGRRPFVRRPKVLIVDDERDLAEALGRNLSLRGVLVDVEANPSNVLDRLASHPVDVVVLDVEMPDVSGLELLQRIRKQRARTLSLFVMTGASNYTAEQCIALGAEAFFRKPVDADELTFAVFTHCVESAYEHSRWVRVDVDLPVVVDASLSLRIDNLGFGGAFIPLRPDQLASESTFQIGRSIRMDMLLDERADPIRVEGEVVWQRVALRPFERSGVGVKFIAPDAAARYAIERFVRRRKLVALTPWLETHKRPRRVTSRGA